MDAIQAAPPLLGTRAVMIVQEGIKLDPRIIQCSLTSFPESCLIKFVRGDHMLFALSIALPGCRYLVSAGSYTKALLIDPNLQWLD